MTLHYEVILLAFRLLGAALIQVLLSQLKTWCQRGNLDAPDTPAVSALFEAISTNNGEAAEISLGG
ncbi:hypothetical protein PG993_013398 [Apiospora rasikravindrae]|uniref:Uncharacterized protein n=1 Tax=Apiospora rasikravindrae TaxID=990691 RepID=A0ABR1RXI4_9PEZI